MLILSSLATINNRLLAYSFESDSGLSNTATKAGYSPAININSITGNIVNTVLSLVGVFFLILAIYGGITWMTAEGDEAKVEKAQGILRTAIIGLAITLSAYAVSFFILSIFFKN
jgi:hypothetical protein